MSKSYEFDTYTGPLATTRACRLCSFVVTTPKGIRGVGRAYGMVQGNKDRGKIIQHLKKIHNLDLKGV